MRFSKSATFCILCLISCIWACQSESKVTEYGTNGVLYKVYHIDKDSLQHGPQKVYYDDGATLFEEANYHHGTLHGIRKIYYDNGQIETKESYDHGKLTDTLYSFYKDAQLKLALPYDQGVITGESRGYYPSGQLKELVTFANNTENGPFTEYYTNGELKWKGSYLNGDHEVGPLEHYDSTGQLIRKLLCDSLSICKTIWKLGDE